MLSLIREKEDIWQYLKCQCRPIFIYGMGNGADKIMDRLENIGVKAAEVFASDSFVRQKSFRGYPIKKLSEIETRYKDPIILLSFATFREDVLADIYEIASKHELLAPYVPVYGSGGFDMEYVSKYNSELKYVWDNLADDKSRRVYLDIINYMLSGKIEYLRANTTPRGETYRELLGPDHAGIFFDAGAYNGDTVKEFITAREGEYHSIYACEPSLKNYNKLLENTKEYKDIFYFNCALSGKAGTAYLNSGSGRQGSLSRRGGYKTEINTVDGILNGKKADIIKYDVEGEELKALEGSRETIKNYRPCLIVSAYHKTEDLFKLPRFVLGINPGYSLYLTRPQYIPPWDTIYIFKQREENR